jgi:hypothetical protein
LKLLPEVVVVLAVVAVAVAAVELTVNQPQLRGLLPAEPLL